MDEILKRDQNRVTVLAGVTDDASMNITMLRVDPTTKRLLVSATGIPTGIAIGDQITGGIAPAILYLTAPDILAQSPMEFSFVPGGLFHAQITDGATYNSDLSISSSGVAMLTNDINTGQSGAFTADMSHGTTMNAALGLTASAYFHVDLTQASGQWKDATTTASSVLDINQATISWTSAGVDSRVEAASNRVRLQYDNGAGLVSNSIFDANQYMIKWDNSAGTTASTYGTSFGATQQWSDGTIQAVVSAGNAFSYAQYDNGVGDIASTYWNPTNYTTKFVGANGYTAQSYGAVDQRIARFTTPFQLVYNNASGVFDIGESIVGQSSGATADIFVDEGTYFILGNVVGTFQASEIVEGQTNFNTADVGQLTSQIGIWDAVGHAGQDVDVTTYPSRYAFFRNDTTSQFDRYELKHPNSALFVTPTLSVDTGSTGTINAKTQYNVNNSFFATQNIATSNVRVGFNAAPGADGGGAERITAIGTSAGSGVSSGDDNTFLGHRAGETVTTGVENTFIGVLTDATAAGRNGSIAIGYNAMASADNQFALPDTVTGTKIRGNPYIWPVNAAAAPSVLRNDGATNLTWFDMNQGSYIPTVTNTTNISSTSPAVAFWYRIGNRVTVFGQILVDPTTTATFTVFEMDLPVASNFANSSECAGVGMSGTAQESFQVLAEVTNNTALVWFTPINVTSQSYSYQFSYTVI